MPLHGTVAQGHFHKTAPSVAGVAHLTRAFGHLELSAGEERVDHEEVLGGAGRLDAQGEVAYAASLPPCGGLEPIGYLETAAHAVRHAVAVGMAHLVHALMEGGVEAIGVGIACELLRGVVVRTGVGCVELARLHHGIAVGQHGAVHLHGEVVDIGMYAVLAHGVVGIVRILCLETHLHGLGGSMVQKLIVYLHPGIAVIAEADGEHLFLNTDIGLPDGYKLVAVGVIDAVVGLQGLQAREQEQNADKISFHVHNRF